MGDNRLVAGSKLDVWFDMLGKPDFVTESQDLYNTTQIYWLTRGVAVQIDGSYSANPEDGLGERVVSVIVPLKKEIYTNFAKQDQSVETWHSNTKLVTFGKLLDVRIENQVLTEASLSLISDLYKYSNSGNDNILIYSNSPYLIKKVETSLFLTPNQKSEVKRNKIEIIVINDVDIFNIYNWFKMIRRLISLTG